MESKCENCQYYIVEYHACAIDKQLLSIYELEDAIGCNKWKEKISGNNNNSTRNN